MNYAWMKNKTLTWQFFYEDAKVRQWKIYVYNETGGLWATLLTWGRVPFTRHICAKLWLYHDWLSKRNPTIISFLKMMWSIIVKTLLPFTQGCFVSSLIEIGPMVLEKILKFRQCFSLFRNYLPLQTDEALHLNKFEPPSTSDTLCQVWFKMAQ